MSEELNQGANVEEVAAPQETQETSVETSEVADPKPVQDAETNAHYAEQRRKQELEEYRTKASEYETHLRELAELSGFQSTDELFHAIEEQKKAAERQRYEQAGIDPDTFNSLLEQHPDVQFAREMKAKQQEEQRLQSDWSELSEKFPDLQPTDVPTEVWQLQDQIRKSGRDISLLDAYLRHNYDHLAQQKEQEALKKLQQNQTSSTGSLSQGEVEHNTSVKSMSKDDFETLLRKVKNGEVRNL